MLPGMEQGQSLETFLQAVGERSWSVFRRDALTYVLASALVSLLSAISLGLLAGPLCVGFIELVRRGARGEPIRAGDVFGGFSRFGTSFLVLLLVGIAAGLGMLVLILPGLLVLLFTAFALPAVAYEQLGAVDALRRSYAIVRQHFVPTLMLLVVLSVLNSLGGSIVIGVLVTTPLTLIAISLAFEQLAGGTPQGGAGMPPGVIVR
jgi:hypothetical protein